MITRALKYARQQGGGKQKFVLEKGAAFSVDDAITKLLQFQKHLQSLQEDGALVLKEQDKVKMMVKARKKAIFPWNMVKSVIKKINFVHIFRIFCKKKTEISI